MEQESKIFEIMENETTNIRKMKKQELIKYGENFGYTFKKKYNRNLLIEQLIPIHRKMVLNKKILLEKEECPICITILNQMNFIITDCGHAFCRECIFKYVTTDQEICPICRAKYTYDDLIKPFSAKEVELLLFMISKKKEEEQQEEEDEEEEQYYDHQSYISILHQNMNNHVHNNKKIYRIIYYFLNCFLFWKSIEFLYYCIIEDESIRYYSNSTLE